jgi:hypothetical protein
MGGKDLLFWKFFSPSQTHLAITIAELLYEIHMVCFPAVLRLVRLWLSDPGKAFTIEAP